MGATVTLGNITGYAGKLYHHGLSEGILPLGDITGHVRKIKHHW